MTLSHKSGTQTDRETRRHAPTDRQKERQKDRKTERHTDEAKDENGPEKQEKQQEELWKNTIQYPVILVTVKTIGHDPKSATTPFLSTKLP